MVRILTTQNWDPAKVPEMLDALRTPPLKLLEDTPETYFTVCAHLLGYGALALPDVWPALEGDDARVGLFLRVLASILARSGRRFAALPVDFLDERVRGLSAETRAALFDLLAVDASPGAVDVLTAAVLREKDPGAALRGGAALKRLLQEAPE